MGFGAWWHWVVVALVVLVLFGRGRISETMGDFGKGIRSFKKGLNEEDKPATPPPPAQQISPPPVADVTPAPAPNPTSTEN
jgi:sec-independent protein translocase protein TatA